MDYIIAEARRQVSTENASEMERVADAYADVAAAALEEYLADEGEIPDELFTEVALLCLGALTAGPTQARDTRAKVGLSEMSDTPSRGEIIVWRPRERVSGYMYQFEICVDLAGQTVPGPEPLLVMMFYSIRTRELMTYGEALGQALSDFEEGAAQGGPYAGQALFGGVVTGVYHFNPKR